MGAVELASDTRWYPGALYELAWSPQVEREPPPGGITWLSYQERDGTIDSAGEYYDVSPIAERLEQLGVDVPRRYGSSTARADLTGLLAPELGLRPSGTFTAFAVEPSPKLAERLGVFSCLRSTRVAFLAFPTCLVTMRHRSRIWIGRRGGSAHPPVSADGGPFAGREALQKAVETAWAKRPDRSGVGDLAILVLRALSRTLPGGTAYLADRLEEAEGIYFSVLDTNDDDLDEIALRSAQRNLFDLAGILTSLGRELTTLTANIPDDHPWVIGDRGQKEASDIVHDYAEALATVRTSRQDLRTSVDMTASTLASRQLVIAHRQELRAQEQLRLAQEQRDRNDRFMRDATLIASLVLLPTLVATVYGANVGLPLKNEATGTIVMLAVMLVAAFAAWQALRLRYGRDP